MAYTLRILFHGTVALVPDAKLESCTRMRMLLGQFEPQPGVRDQFAYVRFPIESVRKDNKRRLLAPGAAAPQDSFNLRHIKLVGERLTLISDTPRQTLQINSAKHAESNTPTACDARSLHWLPTLSRLNGNPLAVNPELLKDEISKDQSPTLAGRFDIREGSLETTGVLPIAVTFADKIGKLTRQPIARDVVLQLKLESREFHLVSRHLIEGDADQLPLKLQIPKDQDDLTITIGNEPPDDIYLAAPYPEFGSSRSEEFRLFYLLSETAETDGAVVPLFSSKGGLHQICAHAIYDPSGIVQGETNG